VVATGKSIARNVTRFIERHAALLAETRPKILIYSLFATEKGIVAFSFKWDSGPLHQL